MEICSKDTELDAIFWKHHGPKEESTLNFFKRYYCKLCDTLISPSRCSYLPEEITALSSGNVNQFDTVQFQVYSKGISIAACLWKRKILKLDDRNRNKQICIIYMHTNTRALIDAKEICIASELCDNISVAAFDLPGCGKSEGCLSGTVYKDLEVLIEWIQCLISSDVQIILWARGMSTAAAIEFTAHQNGSSKSPSPAYAAVKAVVLDSPFTSIGDMVSDAADILSGRGYSPSKSIMEMCTKMVVRTMSQRLGGFNPLQVKPIDLVGKCRVPAFIMSALHDDYISSVHGQAIAAGWAGPKMFKTFPGSHFGQRPDALAVEAFTFIAAFLDVTIISGSMGTSQQPSSSPPAKAEKGPPHSECVEAPPDHPHCEKAEDIRFTKGVLLSSELGKDAISSIFEVGDGEGDEAAGGGDLGDEAAGGGDLEEKPRPRPSQLGLCSGSGIGGFYFHSLSLPGSSQSLQSMSSTGNLGLLLRPVLTSPSEKVAMS